MKQKRRKILFICWSVLVFVLFTGQFIYDPLDVRLRYGAGPGAVNCGTLGGRDESAASYNRRAESINACASAAYVAHRPFLLRQDSLLDGVRGSIGAYGTADGRIQYFHYNRVIVWPKLEVWEDIFARQGKKREAQTWVFY